MVSTMTVGFIPPVVGVDGVFNTFRLGSFYSKNLKIGEHVFLLDEKTKRVFGKAEVTEIITGKLKEMCELHGQNNHTELVKEDRSNSAESLMLLLRKIYGPHIATDNKGSTVIYMKRIE